jgi:hypothetical protein
MYRSACSTVYAGEAFAVPGLSRNMASRYRPTSYGLAGHGQSNSHLPMTSIYRPASFRLPVGSTRGGYESSAEKFVASKRAVFARHPPHRAPNRSAKAWRRIEFPKPHDVFGQECFGRTVVSHTFLLPGVAWHVQENGAATLVAFQSP